jgi:hypothetical protein
VTIEGELSLNTLKTCMNTNLDELKDLVGTLKSDRLAQKEKEQRDGWTKYVSLSMICLAVLAAIATQRGAGYSSGTMKQLNEATFNQAQASDQWAFFQAKGIKQSIYEQERDRLNIVGSPDAKVLGSVVARIDRYEKEKKEISAEAKSTRVRVTRLALLPRMRPIARGRWAWRRRSFRSPLRSAVCASW